MMQKSVILKKSILLINDPYDHSTSTIFLGLKV